MQENQNFGTREISDVSYNSNIGCSHDCKYCYAAAKSAKNGTRSRDEWKHEKFCLDRIFPNTRHDGLVMYPTHHDITPRLIAVAMTTVNSLVIAGNEVLVATKPHLSCVQYLCQHLRQVRERIRFMFSITSLDDCLSAFWEPGAPSPYERVSALKYAFANGFRTSVLIEPMLEGVSGTMRLYETVLPYVTEDIWFGLMQSVRDRVDLQNPANHQAYEVLQSVQTEDNVRFLHQHLDGKDKVRWKESVLRVIRRPEPEIAIEYIGGEVVLPPTHQTVR